MDAIIFLEDDDMKYMNDKYQYFNYPEFYKWVANNSSINTVAEIGSWLGDSTVFLAKEMLKTRNSFKIYCVDLWENIDQYRPFREDEGELLKAHKEARPVFEKNIKDNNVDQFITQIQRVSWEAAECLEDNSLDLVFLDADHTYEGVKKDIIAWLPKLKTNGILSGHDYFERSCGVSKAVNDTLTNVKTIFNIWYKNK